jgi:hypothetical protein
VKEHINATRAYVEDCCLRLLMKVSRGDGVLRIYEAINSSIESNKIFDVVNISGDESKLVEYTIA